MTEPLRGLGYRRFMPALRGNRATAELRRELRELTPAQRFLRQLEMSRTALRLRDAGRAAKR